MELSFINCVRADQWGISQCAYAHSNMKVATLIKQDEQGFFSLILKTETTEMTQERIKLTSIKAHKEVFGLHSS